MPITKEEKKAVTALDKALPSLVRPLIKPYRYKSISGMVWTVRGEVLFTLVPWLAAPTKEDRPYVRVSCEAKPLFLDDLLWDILGFEENKAAPMSLRVNGAFALFPVTVYQERRSLETVDSQSVTAFLQEELERFSDFLTSVESREMAWFRELESKQENYAQMELSRLLLALHDGKRDEVLAYVSAHSVSDYIVGRKTVGELIGEYCI